MKLRHATPALALCVCLPSLADAADPVRRGDPGRHSATVWHPTAGTTPYGLSQFKVQGDQAEPLATLGALLGLGFATGWFGGDFELDLVYEVLPPASRSFTARRETCSGVCDLSLEPPGADEVLVLTGFMAEAADGQAHPIEAVGVRPDPDSGVVEVELSGDVPFDYEAIVQYAYVPASSVVGGTVYSQTKTNHEPHRRLRFTIDELEGDYGRSILHGFDAHFLDGAHPLQKMTVRALGQGGLIWFLDDDHTHVYEGTLQLVRLSS